MSITLSDTDLNLRENKGEKQLEQLINRAIASQLGLRLCNSLITGLHSDDPVTRLLQGE